MWAWHEAVLARLAANNASCVHSVQPSWNNEYETKYSQVGCCCCCCATPTVASRRSQVPAPPGSLSVRGHVSGEPRKARQPRLGCFAHTQEGDGAQDYSKPALQLFCHYLHSVHGDLAYWNERWGTDFADWADVMPTKFFQHGENWGNTADDVLYWDWQHFRHRRIHQVHEAACQHIAQHGFRCIMHFPEFMTGSDAIYASGSIFTLAASPGWITSSSTPTS